MLKGLAIFAGALGLMATSAFAQTYECKFSGGRNMGTISPEVLVVFDGQGNAQITDRLSERHGRAPVQARFAQDNEKQMRVRWRLEDVIGNNGRKATLEWSLVHKKKRNKAHVTFNAFGFANTESGSGTCTPVK